MLRKPFPWLALLVVVSSDPASAGRIEHVSKKGVILPPHAVGAAGGPAVSADGRFVAFLSTAPNLMPGQSDGNNGPDVFLWDRTSGEVRLVSHRSGSVIAAANGASSPVPPRISADGRWIAFCSSGWNLIPDQEPPQRVSQQMYLYDRLTDATTLVSASLGAPLRGGNFDSCQYGFDLSPDGRHLAFDSSAGDLVSPAAPVQYVHVYHFDRLTGQLTLASHAAGTAGERADSGSTDPSISADGRWIAYRSYASNLVAGVDGNGLEDAFLFDHTTGQNILISHASGAPATAGDRQTFSPEISSDGSWVAFASESSNLVPGQSEGNGGPDVFLWERATGTMQVVSRAHGGTAMTGNGSCEPWVALGPDGAWLAYGSSATDLVAGVADTNGDTDVFLFERATGTNTLVSRAAGAAATGNGRSSSPVLPADGSRVLFSSLATNLAAGVTDGNGASDLFVWERATGNVTLVSHAHGTPAVTGNDGSTGGVVAAGGSAAVFASSASDLAPATSGDTNEGPDLFHRNLGAGTTAAISYSPVVLQGSGNGPSEVPARLAAGANGRFVIFLSGATDLIPGQVDTNESRDVFLHDRLTDATVLVSRSAGTSLTTANGDSVEAIISRESRYVAFTSWATDLVPGQLPKGKNAFLFDRQTGSLVQASNPNSTSSNLRISADGRYLAFINGNVLTVFDRVTGLPTQPQPGAPVTALEFTQDARYIVYASSASNVIPGQIDTNGEADIFLHNRDTGATILVSRNPASPVTTGNGASPVPAGVSWDGRFVLFQSSATDLVPGQVDANGQPDYFLFDRTTGTVALVSHAAASLSTSANQGASMGVLSEDGRFAAFRTEATDVVPGQQNAAPGGVFLYDRATGGLALVSHVAGSLTTSGGGRLPAISGDGSRVVFASSFPELIPGLEDENGREDLFLYDRFSGSLELISHALASPGVSGNAGAAPSTTLSEDGRVILFTSDSGDLVPFDFNLAADVFASLPAEQDFHTLTPCRLFDSRRPEDGPALDSGFARVVEHGGACGIPATAKALAVNVTVIQPGSAGYLTLYPGDGLPPLASTLTFGTGETRTNNATVRLAPSGTGTLAIRPVLAGGGGVHVAVDVVGFFE